MPSFSILVFNTDRSTLKFELFDKCETGELKSIMCGKIKNIGGSSTFEWCNDRAKGAVNILVKDLKDATDWVLDWLEHLWPLGSLLEDLRVVAHHCVNCVSQNTSTFMRAGKYEPECPLIYQPDPLCMIGTSRNRLPEHVKVIVVFNMQPENSSLSDANEEAQIADTALKALKAA
ncbi:MAG TPA: hypothetical protein VFS17_08490 [Methylophilaceae bacterium]|nr:hypothetical protein [Methylophilaceae bacterium]